MKILLDHCVNTGFRKCLSTHDVRTAREMGWDELKNGQLLRALRADGFDVLLSVDKKIRYEHNLERLPVCVVILDSKSNALPDLLPFVPTVQQFLTGKVERALYFVGQNNDIAILGRRS